MPTDSPYEKIDIPNIGVWDLMFDRKDRGWPDDQCKFIKPTDGSVCMNLSLHYCDIAHASR